MIGEEQFQAAFWRCYLAFKAAESDALPMPGYFRCACAPPALACRLPGALGLAERFASDMNAQCPWMHMTTACRWRCWSINRATL